MDNYNDLKSENKQLKQTVIEQKRHIDELEQENDALYESIRRNDELDRLMEVD